MAHFALIDEFGTVLDVIKVSNENAPDPATDHSEPLGQEYLASIGLDGEWRQTSFHGNFRKQYAGIGYRYDDVSDVFIAPQPYPSWSLDGNHDWQPPVPRPEDGGLYVWDENSLSWTLIQ